VKWAAGGAIAVAAAAGLAVLILHAAREEPRPPVTTTFVVHITDRGTPVGARVLLFAGDQPVHMGRLDVYEMRQGAAACPIAPGVVASWDGLIVATGDAEIPVGSDNCTPWPAIPFGRYHVWAWRGVEFERWEGDVDLRDHRGRVVLDIPLERAWTPHGALAADLHVHAYASNDSTVPNPQRVIAQVAAGIQVIGLSDHNVNGDLDRDIAELGLGGVVDSIASNELSSDNVHLGIYPVQVQRDQPYGGSPASEDVEAAEFDDMFTIAHAFPGNPIIQVNHPRFRVSALYDNSGWDGTKWPPPFPLTFDAVEVVAGYTAFNDPDDRRFDESARDYYTMIDHGHPYAPVGNSDTHDLNWVLDGTARTYVFVDNPRVNPFDQDAFIAAIRARRVVATTGPWLDVEVASAHGATPTVGPGNYLVARGTAWVDVTVAQARFVATEWIRIVVGTDTGPRLVQTVDVPPGVRSFHWAGSIPVGDADTWIVVSADGDTALPIEQTGTYQRDKWHRPGVTPFAIAGPILVDTDDDGRWTRGDANFTYQ